MKSISSLEPKSDIGSALRAARRAKHVSQEGFEPISSRTYVSALERGIKQPTITKIDDLASVLGIHPLTLLVLAYIQPKTPANAVDLLSRVNAEIKSLALPSNTSPTGHSGANLPIGKKRK